MAVGWEGLIPITGCDRFAEVHPTLRNTSGAATATPTLNRNNRSMVFMGDVVWCRFDFRRAHEPPMNAQVLPAGVARLRSKVMSPLGIHHR